MKLVFIVVLAGVLYGCMVSGYVPPEPKMDTLAKGGIIYGDVKIQYGR